MANSNIMFKIGSSFSGEGFRLARQEIGNLNKNLQMGSGAIGKIASEFGTLDGKAAKAASAVAGLINSFMTMNPVIAGITIAISILAEGFRKLREREEEAKKVADELRASHEKLATKINQGIFDRAIKDAANLGAEFDRLTKHANDMTAAINALNNQTATRGVLQLQADKIAAVFDEVTEEGKRLVSAEYDLKIATAEAALMRQRSEQNLEAAQQAVADKNGEIENLLEQRKGVEIQLQRLKDNNVAFETASREEREKWLKNISDLESKICDVDSKIIANKQSLEVLMVKEQTAIEALTAAETSATMKVEVATHKQDELQEEIEKRTSAEAEAAEIAKNAEEVERIEIEGRLAQKIAAEEEAEAEKRLRDALNESENLRKEQDKASEALKRAELDLADALSVYARNYSFWKLEQDINDGVRRQGNDKSTQLEAGRAAVAAGIANGAIRDSLTAHQVKMAAERADRDTRSSKIANQIKRDDRELERLKNMNPKAMSERDKNRLKELQDLKNARDSDVKKAKETEQKIKNDKSRLENIEKSLKEIVETIKEKADKLGIK